MAMNHGQREDNESEVPCFCSQRWILAYVSFFGFFCLYAVRFNLSVAIVCMVKSEPQNISTTSVFNQTDTCEELDESSTSNERGEFDWDKDTRSTILSSFFYGYLTTQILGGLLADKFGGRLIIGMSFTLCGICTLLTPICARTSVVLVYVIRVILGIASGGCFPAMHSVWGKWAPSMERTKLLTLYTLGPLCGNVVTFISSGLLCEYGFDNGWGSIFYIIGGLTLLAAFLWFIVVRDSPAASPWITKAERKYISSNIEYDIETKKPDIPWVSIATSVPMYACMTAQICEAWMAYTILTSIPAFMKSVLKFDMKSNGFFSALPTLCELFVIFIAGQSADIIRSRGIMSTTATRRFFTVSAFVGATVFIILAGFTTCDQRYITVVYLCLAVSFMGLAAAGFSVNHVDYAAKYAGILMGITNMMANIPGVLTPIVAGKLTPNDTKEEWRNVFYVCGAFNMLGCIVYGFFSSGEVQKWAKDDTELEITQEWAKEDTDNKELEITQEWAKDDTDNKKLEITQEWAKDDTDNKELEITITKL